MGVIRGINVRADGWLTSRREFWTRLPLIPAAVAAVGSAAGAVAEAPGPRRRAQLDFDLRGDAARHMLMLPVIDHVSNGDENRYAGHINSYTKALPHDDLGIVAEDAYTAMLQALDSGDPALFEAIPIGGTVRLVNPQAAYAYGLRGADSAQVTAPPTPLFSSASQAGEAVELYWHALARDVPFLEYDSNPFTRQAAAELSAMSDFQGPKESGRVTTRTLFRGDTPGDLAGPYVSQFMVLPVPYGVMEVEQRFRSGVTGINYMTTYAEWLRIQQGQPASQAIAVESAPTFLRCGRDLTRFVHDDFSFQEYMDAALILYGFGDAALSDAADYYRTSKTQAGFATHGLQDLVDMVSLAAKAALLAAWYQKWIVHRRARPEEFAGRVHNRMLGKANYPIHPDVLNSAALKTVFDSTGTYLLPQAYPEGCPAHPSYPSGHATIAGACVTMLKALFREDFVIPNPSVATSDGSQRLPYSGPPLTVGGELNKLASNVGIGRNWAGIHWRTDFTRGIRLGEAVAYHLMEEMGRTYNEPHPGFTFTNFDGEPVYISAIL